LREPFTHDLIIAARKRANYSRALFPDAFRARARALLSARGGTFSSFLRGENNRPSLGKRMLAEQNGHGIVHAPAHARVWEIFDFSERRSPQRTGFLWMAPEKPAELRIDPFDWPARLFSATNRSSLESPRNRALVLGRFEDRD